MRSIATVGDIYGPDAGSTFYNNNAGPGVGMAGTTVGSDPAMAGAATAAVNPIPVLTQMQGTILGNGVFQWFLIASVVVFTYAMAKRHLPNVETELGTPRVSIPAFLSIGVQAFLFLVLVKVLLKKFQIPGLSGLAANA